MLKLHQLEVSGFKSFVEPLTVRFSDSINAIVGPNGCGKSNLADAINWVLGEQSAKTLRGDTMEDVIFGGSEKRRPLGMAEVTLTLRAPEGNGSQNGTITLGRRVFRSGESRYSLNGKTVRLRDIKDLLMDTGLGIRTYSVIEQGKIDLILSGKPQERRKLLEEAAGVTRYKARRRLAEVKLEEATANLLRLDDVLSEVERALRSLKRQSGAARRFQRRELEYRELLERVLLARAGRLAVQLAERRAAIELRTDREAELVAGLAQGEAELAATRETVDRLSRELAERHQRDAGLAATIEGRQEFLRGASETIEEIGGRLAQGEATRVRRAEELELFRSELSRLATLGIELQRAFEEASSAVLSDREEITERDVQVRRAEESRRQSQDAVVEAAGRLGQLRQRQQTLEVEGEKRRYRRAHLEADLEQRHEHLRGTQQALQEAQERQGELELRVQELEVRSTALAGELQDALELEARSSEQKRELEDSQAADRQRQRLLEEIAEAERQRRTGIAELLAAAGLPGAAFLGERLESPPPGWEASLDQFLGSLSEAALVPPDNDAAELADRLADERRGAALFVPDPQGAIPVVTIEDPAVVAPLGEALGLPTEIASALPPAFLVEQIEDALRLARLHPGVAFLSRRGPWARSGLVRSEGAPPQPGRLARDSELSEIAERQQEREARLEELTRELEEQVVQRTYLATRGRQLQDELGQARQHLAVIRARREDLQAREGREREERDVLQTEQERIARELEAIATESEQISRGLGEAEGDHRQRSLDFESATQGVDQARTARETLRTGAAERQGRLEVVEERLRSHQQQVERLQREIDDADGQLRGWSEERATLRQRRTELEAGIERSEVELQGALEGRAASQEAVLAHQEQLDRRKETIRELEEAVGTQRQERDELRERLEELRVDSATLRQEEAHLGALFAEQLRRPLPGELEPIDEEELAELEADLSTCKEALDRLGPVNVLAAQEHDEQEERRRFLTEQRADVSESVERLKQTIREINETSSVRFKETFLEVNKTFGEVFARLFRGGEAEMRLLDEEDYLESGIEIVARPPGKRLQNMMLLSGGEKALTALALLFALFHTKPTPFCILDEVDAPLDDVNTLRFVELLEGMAERVQFLVITHNKLTMEAASSLYGVTMQERGVSKLVSVELDEVQPGDAPN